MGKQLCVPYAFSDGIQVYQQIHCVKSAVSFAMYLVDMCESKYMYAYFVCVCTGA